MIINPKSYQHKNNHKEERPKGFFIRKLLKNKIKPSLSKIKQRLQPIRKSKRLSKIRESFKEVIKIRGIIKTSIYIGSFWLLGGDRRVLALNILNTIEKNLGVPNNENLFENSNIYLLLTKTVLFLVRPLKLPIVLLDLSYSPMVIFSTNLAKSFLVNKVSEKV